jgi:hypothetical protein
MYGRAARYLVPNSTQNPYATDGPYVPVRPPRVNTEWIERRSVPVRTGASCFARASPAYVVTAICLTTAAFRPAAAAPKLF